MKTLILARTHPESDIVGFAMVSATALALIFLLASVSPAWSVA
jgi:hypothetical protein